VMPRSCFCAAQAIGRLRLRIGRMRGVEPTAAPDRARLRPLNRRSAPKAGPAPVPGDRSQPQRARHRPEIEGPIFGKPVPARPLKHRQRGREIHVAADAAGGRLPPIRESSPSI
jgi:hypothetical protein